MKQNMEPMLFCLLGEKTVREPLHYTACGLDNVYLCSGFTQEELDGEIYTSVKGVDHLHMMIAFRLSVLRRPLVGKEVRFLRKYLDLTQQEMADRFGVHRKTVNAYECGREPISWERQTILQLRALTHLLKTLKRLVVERSSNVYGRFEPQLEEVMEYLLHMEGELNDRESDVAPPFVVKAMIGQWKMQSGCRAA